MRSAQRLLDKKVRARFTAFDQAAANLPIGLIVMKSALKDPLVLFLALGALIFLIATLGDGGGDDGQIVVGQADLDRLNDQWHAQMGRPPTPEEVDGLVAQHIREEVYFHEAKRLSLDEGDVIVRRRLVQKLQFLTEDIATGQPPAEPELRAFFAANPERYRQPARYSFSHRYFSTDRREHAEADAQAALADAAPTGDPFMLQRTYAARSVREIGNLFGNEFAEGLNGLEPSERWQGPIRSAYGWHLVLLDARLPERLPAYEEVADRVAVDFNLRRRERANEAYYQSLLERYEVQRP